MADFDVKPPTTNPQDYLNMSRPLSPYFQYMAANQKGEILAKGLGQDLVLGAESGDAVMKRQISYDIHQQTDPETDKFVEALNIAKDYKEQQQTPSGPQQMPNVGGMWGQQGYGVIPQQVKSAVDQVDNLHQGMQQGKVSETQYLAKMYTIAKNVRATYPGYRDYVDEEFHRITGRPIANEYVASLLSDINRGSGGENKLQNERISALMEQNKNGVPGADRMISLYTSGQITGDKVDTFINQANAYKNREATLKSNVYVSDQNDQVTAKAAVQYMNTRGANVVATTMRETLAHMGIDTDSADAASNAVKAAERFRSGPEADKSAALMNQAIVATKQQLYAEFTQPGPDGQSMLDKVGGDRVKLNKDIDAMVQPLADWTKGLSEGNVSMAALNEQLNSHIVSDRIHGWYTDKSVGQLTQSLASMSKILGPAGATWGQVFATAQLSKASNMTNMEKAFSTSQELPMLFPPAGQEPKPVAKAIEDAKAVGAASAPVMDDFVKQVKYIADQTAPMEVRVNAAKAFFGPGNQNLLDNFKTDYTDPQTGRKIPAKYSVFTRMTSPDIAAAMHELGKTDPNMWQMYKNWVETQFAFKLFGPDIQSLNDVPVNNELKFHPETHHFSLEPTGPQSHDVASLSQISFYNNTIDNVNLGMDSLYNTEHYDNKGRLNTSDAVNSYLLNVLRTQGFDPQHPSAKAIIDAIKSGAAAAGKALESSSKTLQEGEGGASGEAIGEIVAAPRRKRKAMEDSFKSQDRVLPGGLGATQ